MKEIVAIIGRPNVGKSSLFNLIAGKRLAIVHNMPGVTRDRNYTTSEWYGVEYLLIDTGGIDYTEDKEVFKEMISQANLAIEEATKIIFLMDGKDGITRSDEELVNYLRKYSDKDIFYAVNKVDSLEKEEILISEFYTLGVEKIYPISVLQKLGIDQLFDDIFENSERVDEVEIKEDKYVAKVAVVGRPNVGKSSFINKLLGDDRLIVQDESGTTRDSIDTEITHYGKKYLFIDTAGIRKKAKIKYSLEKYMVVKAFISMDRADVVILIIDATENLTDQDKKLIALAFEKGKPIIILVNKWDLIDKNDKTYKNFKEEMNYQLKEVKIPEIEMISALSGKRVFSIFKKIEKLKKQSDYRATTGELNRFMVEVVNGHPHPIIKGKPVKIKYMTQVSTNPPTFIISVNRPELIKKSYTRFLMNQLRKRYPFGSVPIKIFYRSTKKEITEFLK